MMLRYRLFLVGAICLLNVVYCIGTAYTSSDISDSTATESVRRRLVDPDAAKITTAEDTPAEDKAAEVKAEEVVVAETTTPVVVKSAEPEQTPDATTTGTTQPPMPNADIDTPKNSSDPKIISDIESVIPPSACADAKTCEECKTAGMLVQSTTAQVDTCVVVQMDGDNGEVDCHLVPLAEVPATDMCLKTVETQKMKGSTDNHDDDDGGGSFFNLSVGLLALVLLGAAYMRFKKGKKGLSLGGDGDASVTTEFGSILGSNMSSYSKSET